MDMQHLRRAAASGTSSLIDLPEYIITSFLPGARPLLDKYPRLFRFLGVLLAFWYLGPVARLQAIWSRFSSILVAAVSVSSEEDLFGYVTSYISERKTLRADQSLTASSNPPQESRRRGRHDPDYEESSRRTTEDPKIKYEQGQGLQLFIHKKRLFYITRKYGEGHTYHGNRYKRIELITLSCLGRSTQPIKDLLEHIYFLNKDKERSLTIIRRPYTGGYGSRLTWSRLTSKPRRALDTVILDATKKEQVLADVEEYMDEATMTFYANHGIPYRRGYLFHGPPGVGKTSFALALASKFNLDVYNLTLLDQDLTDSDLISLLNQLPGRSLLLLEDIDTAGLNRKGKTTSSRRTGGMRRMKLPEGVVGTSSRNKSSTADDPDLDSDDESGSGITSRVTLSGLLNAIDGVAAPEGHILVMTTNRPFQLDDALVRAGRISVRVEFKNASKRQAEEIFLRMYVDLPSTSPPWDEKLDDKELPAAGSMVKEITPPAPAVDGEDSARLRTLAKKFAELIPDYEFSPADLQDFLLIHKKDADKAVEGLPAWMKHTYEERQKKEDDKEAERAAKRDAKRQQLRQFRAEIKKAVKDEDTDEADDGEQDSSSAKEDGAKDVANETPEDVEAAGNTSKSTEESTAESTAESKGTTERDSES